MDFEGLAKAAPNDDVVRQYTPQELCSARDKDGASLLHWAAHANNAELIRALDMDVNVRAEITTQVTPLHVATRANAVRAVTALLARGADVHPVDTEGMTPLHVAAAFGHHLIVELLTAHGADVNRPDTKCNRTPINWACAAPAGSPAVVKVLLRSGVNIVQADTLGRQPLHWAVLMQKWSEVVALVAAGAPVDVRDNDAKRPLDLFAAASSYKSAWIIELLGGRRDPYRFAWSPATRATVLSCTVFTSVAGVLASVAYLPSWPQAAVGFLATLAANGLIITRTWPIARLNRRNALAEGLFFGSYFLMYGSFLLDPSLRRFMAEHYPVANVIMWPVSAAVLGLILWARRVGPGYLAQSSDPSAVVRRLAAEDRLSDVHYCWTCGIERPPRSKHDAVTDRCIARFDHFCHIAGCAVGARNHRLFILWIFVGFWSQIAMAFFVERYTRGARDQHLWQIGQTLWSLGLAAWDGWILGTQLYFNVICNLTTNEFSNLRRYDAFWKPANGQPKTGLFSSLAINTRPGLRFHNPYDRGLVGNLRAFLSLS